VIILVVEHVQFARLAAKAFKEDISRKLWCVCVVVVVVVVVVVCVCMCAMTFDRVIDSKLPIYI
jgi:hypothetical protein